MSLLNVIVVDGALTGNRLAGTLNGDTKSGSTASTKLINSDVDHSDSNDDKDEEGVVAGSELQGGMLALKVLNQTYTMRLKIGSFEKEEKEEEAKKEERRCR